MSARKNAETVLVLRTCDKDMRSNEGRFTWPTEGEVSAPDWKPIAECGNGLHGFLWGEGDGDLANWDLQAKWLVVEVEKSSIIDLGGKVKFPSGKVLCVGDRLEATKYLSEHGGAGRAIVGGTATAGYGGTATAGVGGILVMRHWDSRTERYRIHTAYVGEDGIKKDTPYRLDESGLFVPVGVKAA